MKNYYISMDLGDSIPCYDFVIKASNEEEARNIANDILWNDYNEEMSLQGNTKEDTNEAFWCQEITPEELLEKMILN